MKNMITCEWMFFFSISQTIGTCLFEDDTVLQVPEQQTVPDK